MNTLTTRSIFPLLCTWATAILLLAPGSQLLAVEPGRTQYLASPGKVPEGLAPSDWTSIRAAYEARRHAAFAVEGGYQARNPGQQWRTKFDARGFSTQPDAGGWQWGLELRSFGFAGQNPERIEGQAQEVKVEGQRVTYTWNGALEEWFVNDQRGLEHGFTVKARPHDGAVALNSHLSAGAPGTPKPGEGGLAKEEPSTLNFLLAIRGALQAELSPDGQTVRFVDEHGAAVINYAGLKVWDADGTSLPAQFARAEEGIRLRVDERGARYPITIDPIAQQAYLKASNTDAGDRFGGSVAISGDTVVVGAYEEDSSSVGVNGNQSDNMASNAGAAYVFVRSGGTWTQQAYLKASNPELGDQFGYSVAISGATVVVGAPLAPLALGNALRSGAAYIFVRSGGTWSEQASLKASNSGAGDGFGHSVAISGNTVVVGAPYEDSSVTGINGDQSDNNASDSGAAYIFARSVGAWSQQAYLKASNTGADDYFGLSVAISGGTLVVGAYYEDSSTAGVNGNQGDNNALNAGAAYVFVRSSIRGVTSWSQQAYLKASNTDADDWFGLSVAISGDTVVVGAYQEDSSSVGVNGNQSDNTASDAGAAYVFVRGEGGAWTQQAYLKASNTDASDYFGRSVAISGETVVVGAVDEDSSAVGVNGNQSDNTVFDAGAAYVFVRNGVTWTQQAYLKASTTGINEAFGRTVAISGDTVVVGAEQEDSGFSGVNGNQSDNSAADAGAAYVFNDVAATPTPTPTPTPSTTPTPPPASSTLANISTRLRVEIGDNVLIGGFIVSGTQDKKIIVRGIGTSLPFVDRLENPTLELRDPSGALLDSNDNWVDSPNKQAIIDTTIPPTNDLESAIVATLPAGNAAYTAIVRGVSDGTGIGVVEAYDLDNSVDSKLANISTRGLVQTGDNVLIAGTIIVGQASQNVLVRAIGPSLPVPGKMEDPTLELRDGNGGLVAANDNWRSDQEAEIIATTIPPTSDAESAIVQTLAPNSYTAIARGVNNTTGIAVVEVYALN